MAGQLTIDTLKASTGVLATQNGMTGICKAWVNYNATSGAAVIRSSFNVSSITKTSTGIYTINFTTAMPDANYATVGNCATGASDVRILVPNFSAAPTVNGVQVAMTYTGGGMYDLLYTTVAVLGN